MKSTFWLQSLHSGHDGEGGLVLYEIQCIR